MSNITELPFTVIIYILSYKYISIEDIVKFSSTCKKLRLATQGDNIFWRKKFFQRWPTLRRLCKNMWPQHVNIKQEVIKRMKCRKELLDYFSKIYQKCYYRDDLAAPDLKEFDSLFRVEKGASHMKYFYLEDELFAILEQCHSIEQTNLTHVYYARKLLQYMKQCRLTDRWRKFINLPVKQQVLEGVINVMMPWYRLELPVSPLYVEVKLKKKIDQILEFLIEDTPMHSIFAVPDEQLAFWRNNNIDDNYWTGIETRQLLHAIYYVFHTAFNLDVNGLTLHSAVIFHALARRLGIRCDLVYLVSFYYLIWRGDGPANQGEDENENKIEIIHAVGTFPGSNFLYDKTSILNFHARKILQEEQIEPYIVTPTQLALHMAECYLVHADKRTTLEFEYMMNSQNTMTILELANYFFIYNINCTHIVTILLKALDYATSSEQKRDLIIILNDFCQKRLNFLREPSIPRRKRRKENCILKYAIGMIVRCEYEETFYTGVIVGWNLLESTNDSNSQNDVDQLNVPNSNVSNNSRAYYWILASTNKTLSVFQRFITPLKKATSILDHDEIGRYFSHFRKTYYIPNKMLSMEYPDDAVIREMWLYMLS